MEISIFDNKFTYIDDIERARILRFFDENDYYTIFDILIRISEKNPKNIKPFFTELLDIFDYKWPIFEILSSDYNHKLITILREDFLINLIINYKEDSRNFISLFVNTFMLFSEEFRNNCFKEFCENEKNVVKLSEELGKDAGDYSKRENLEKIIFLELDEKQKREVITKSVDKSLYLLTSVYKTLEKDFQDHCLYIVINNEYPERRHLLGFISENIEVFSQENKEIILNKLIRDFKTIDLSTKFATSFEGILPNALGKLFEKISYDKFILFLETILDLNFEVSAYPGIYIFINEIPATLRNKILYPRFISKQSGGYWFGLSDVMANMNKFNLNETLEFFLKKEFNIESIIETFIKNFIRIRIELIQIFLDKILKYSQEIRDYRINSVFYTVLSNPQKINWERYSRIIFELFNNKEFFLEAQKVIKNNFEKYELSSQKQLINNHLTRIIAINAFVSRFNFLQQNSKNYLLEKFDNKVIEKSFLKNFSINTSLLPESILTHIFDKLIINKDYHRYVLIGLKNCNEQINSNKINHYIKNIFDPDSLEILRLTIDLALVIKVDEEVIEKIILSSLGKDKLKFISPLIKKMFNEIPEELKVKFISEIENENVVRDLSKALIKNIHELKPDEFNKLKTLSLDTKVSHLFVWDLVHNFNNIENEIKYELLDNLLNSQNVQTLWRIIFFSLINNKNMIENNTRSYILNKILNNSCAKPAISNILKKYFYQFETEIRNKLLLFSISENNIADLVYIIKKYPSEISSEVKAQIIFIALENNKLHSLIIKALIENIDSLNFEQKYEITKILIENYSVRHLVIKMISQYIKRFSTENISLIIIPFNDLFSLIKELEVKNTDLENEFCKVEDLDVLETTALRKLHLRKKIEKILLSLEDKQLKTIISKFYYNRRCVNSILNDLRKNFAKYPMFLREEIIEKIIKYKYDENYTDYYAFQIVKYNSSIISSKVKRKVVNKIRWTPYKDELNKLL